MKKVVLAFFLILELILFIGASYIGGLLAAREALVLQNRKEQQLLEQTLEAEPLSDWEMLQMAIVKTESDFKPEVRGTNGWGIFQATTIWVKEVNRILGEDKYELKDALDPVKSKEMFDVIQSTYNPDSLVSKAIQLHNPEGGKAYAGKVMNNLEFIRRYERIRGVLHIPE